ncbi:MAG: O-antigen ligase family protein [Sulfobacillus thermotolerans]|nr:O-antigen ligase family protein [Sulfobacillus thermotolerans]
MAFVVCSILAIVGLFLVWGRPQFYIPGLVIAAISVEVIHHWYAGIGQYLPWVGVWVGVMISAGPGVWREWGALLRRQKVSVLLFALYLAGIVASTVVGIDRTVSLRYALGVPAVLVVALLVFPWTIEKGYTTVADVFRIMGLVGILATFSAGIAAIGFHSGFVVPVGHHKILAWQWPFANKNTFGMLLTFALPAASFLALNRDEPLVVRRFWTGGAVLILIGVALSYSRSSWIASMVGIIAFVMLYYGRRGTLYLFGGLILLAGGLVAKTGLHKWQLLWSKGLNGRLVLWTAGFHAMAHHWVLGVGPGNSPAALRPFVPAIYAGLTPSDSLLRTAVELGLWGLVMWVLIVGGALLGLLFTNPWHHWQESAIFSFLLASLAQQVVESLMLGGVSFGDFFFTLFIGLAWYYVFGDRIMQAPSASHLTARMHGSGV